LNLSNCHFTVGVICYVLLSGLSPFMGETDVDTFSNITRAYYDFDDEAFDAITEEAKDFIAGLLVYRKENRMSAKQCLESQWLSQNYDVMGSKKLCTDKLKKFIIRRKWQVLILCISFLYIVFVVSLILNVTFFPPNILCDFCVRFNPCHALMFKKKINK
jgi:serine/threonine protein kinase